MIPTLAKVLDASPDGILVHDGEAVLNVNAAVLRLVGASSRDDVIGRPVVDLLEYPHLKWVERQLTSGEVVDGSLAFAPERLYALDGSICEVEAHAQIFLHRGRPSVFVWVHDLRARQAAEQKLLESLREHCTDEARGVTRRIAGGVAHTINNRLQVVRGFSDLLGEGPLTHEQQLDIDEIVRAADEAADVTRQLMELSGALPHHAEPVHVDALVRGVVQELGAANADLAQRLAVTTEPVAVIATDPRHLRQILEALIANARTATRSRGRITVSVKSTVLDSPSRATDGRRIERGRYVTLEIRDTGAGVSVEDQVQMFIPFFTTASIGEGNGLGLAVVEGLLRQNGAFLTFSSMPGAGAVFDCWFPEAAEARVGERDAPAAKRRPDPLPIMLVDDASGMQSMVVHGLEELGYRVLLVRSEAEVFEVARHVGTPALVVISAAIERQSPRFARRIRAQWPALPILLLAGASADAAQGPDVSRSELRGVHRLAPPFSEYMLISRIQALLDERSAAGRTAS